jgi:hypothetical protein
MRRAQWQYPSGLRLIAEYWPASAQATVVSIFSAEEFGPVMEMIVEWNDVFDIDVSPAISAEQGLQVGQGLVSRIPRWQHAQS